MKIFITFFIFLLPINIFSQGVTEEWVQRFNGTGTVNKDDETEDMIIDINGNIFVTGTSFKTHLRSDIVTLKYNQEGILQWISSYNQAGFNDRGQSIAMDDSGNVYVAGTGININNSSNYTLIKYNPSGVQQWVVHYGNNAIFVDMIIDNTGNIIMSGSVFHPTNLYDITTVKFNPSGILLSESIFTPFGVNSQDYVSEISKDQLNNFYICGSFYNSSNSSTDILLIKYNSLGIQQWVKTYHDNISNSDEISSGISVDNFENIFVTGYCYSNSTAFDIITLKYDISGNLIWDKKYIGNINFNVSDYAYDITTDNIGNCYVTGSVYDSTSIDIITLKYNNIGVLQWFKKFNNQYDNSDEGKSVTVDDFGSVYVTGYSGGNINNGLEYITVKYDSSGTKIWEMTFNGFHDYVDNAVKTLSDQFGNIYVTGRSITDSSGVDIVTIKYSQGSVYAITNPLPDERWIAGEKDTIKWTGGEAGTFLTLEISSDSGVSYDLIDFGVPAETGKYIWDIPENILNTRCIIQILNTATNDTLVKSPLFKIKGYILTKINSMGSYEAFDPGYHGWSYLNNSNPMWPSSWYGGRFNYNINNDPYTNSRYPDFFQSFGAINFPDWPLWVEVYGVNANYWSTFFKIYDSDGQEKWGNISGKSGFQGACFGFAASAFLNFSFKPQFISKHPGMPNTENINSLAITDSIRKYINGYFLYQFGKQSYENDLIGKPKDPKTTLREIINMFKNDEQDIRTISIFNDPDKIFPGKNTGAHTMAPIGVRRDTSAGKYRVLLYDSNNPDDYPYILVDTVANRWSFPFLGNTWQGTSGFYLELPVSNYINRPEFTDQKIDLENIKRGVQNIEIYNTDEADITLKNSSNQLISFVNGNLTEEISNGTAIIKKTGGNSNPIGYYIPDDDYSIEISNVKDSNKISRVAIFKENKSYIFSRNNADSSETDKINIGNSNSDGSSGSGLSVTSPDPVQKDIKLKIINSLNDKERVIEFSGVEMIQNDSLYINDISNSLSTDNSEYEFVIKNFGSEKTYVIKINENDESEQKIFENAFVMLPANSTHIISPNWDNLDSSTVTIFIDSGNNGSIDDSITILNEFELPVELNSFNASVNRNDVELKWVTAGEINNSGFDIERKLNTETSWKKISFIEGFGNSNEPKSYVYNDKFLNTGKYKYRLKQIDYNGNFEYFNLSSEVVVGVPNSFDLSQNYPNPFNPVTKINYDLPFDSKVQMKIYDITGREVFTLVNEQQVAGYYTVEFSASQLSSGVYFYRIISKGLNGVENIQTKKMMLVK